MAMSEPSQPLSGADLARLCDFLYRKTGMQFGESKRYYIERRVADRIAATGTRSFGAYFALVVSSAAECELLINSFTVNETYFFREEHQLQALSQSLLPSIIEHKRPGDKIRIWSVPCSSGEEPYSIAIWLLENWRLVDAYHVEIVGSDIDTQALRQARDGIYGERALSRLPPQLRHGYFHPVDEQRWQIIDDLRESVIFREVNIIDPASMEAEGRFDVVFCRNVLIYFDDLARLKAVRNLHGALAEGGYICLGHSESMGRISKDFKPVRLDDAIVYQKLPEA